MVGKDIRGVQESEVERCTEEPEAVSEIMMGGGAGASSVTRTNMRPCSLSQPLADLHNSLPQLFKR